MRLFPNPGSVRASRAGDGASPSRTFSCVFPLLKISNLISPERRGAAAITGLVRLVVDGAHQNRITSGVPAKPKSSSRVRRVRIARVQEEPLRDANPDNPIRILHTDAIEGLRTVATGSVQACVTSPPFYLLRRYGTTTTWPDGWHGELGHEGHPNDFVRHLLNVFDEVWRTLRDDGCLWVNLADTFNNKQGKKGTTNAPNGSSGRFAAGGKGYAQALRQQPEFFKHYVTGIAHKSEMGVP
jgi:hypothetical protein